MHTSERILKSAALYCDDKAFSLTELNISVSFGG